MAAALAVRFDVWDEVECNSGTMLGTLPDVRTARITQRVAGEDKLQLELLRSSAGWSLLRAQRIIRVIYDDATWDEYRIVSINERMGQNRQLLATIACEGIIMDLLTRGGLCERVEANGLAQLHFEVYQRPPTDHVDIILGSFAPFTSGAPSYFAKGTVDPNQPVDMIYDWDSPHSAFQELAKVTNTEFWVTRNGVSSYNVHMLNELGSTQPEVLLKVGRNILSVSHDTDTEEQATRIYPQGGGSEGERGSMAENGFIVQSIATLMLTLDENIVAENDQWVGHYVEKADGSTVEIIDSVTPNQIEVSSVSGISVSDVIRIVRNSAGDDLTYVELPSAITLYGGPTDQPKSKVLQRGDIPNVNNYVPNSFFDDWRLGGFGDAWCVPNYDSLLGDDEDTGDIGEPEVPGPGFEPRPVDQPEIWGRMDTQGCIYQDTFDSGTEAALAPPWAVSKYWGDSPLSVEFEQTTYRFGELGEFRYTGGGKAYARRGGFAIVDTSTVPQSEQVAEVDVTLQGGISTNQFGFIAGMGVIGAIVLRFQDTDNYYAAGLTYWTSGDLRWYLWKVINGVRTTLDTVNIADSDTGTYTIRMRVADSVQEAWLDGVNALSATDTDLNGELGYAGLICGKRFDVQDSTESPLFNNFDLVAGKTLQMSGLDTGWKIRACSLTAVESGGTATITFGATDGLRCSTLEVLDGSDVVQFTWPVPVCGGSVFTKL